MRKYLEVILIVIFCDIGDVFLLDLKIMVYYVDLKLYLIDC